MPYMVPDPPIFARLQSIFWVVVGMWNVDGRFPEELEIDEWIFLKEATNMYIFERVFPFVVFVCFSFCNICSSWCLLDIGIFGNHWKQTSRSKARLCMSYEVLIMLERVYIFVLKMCCKSRLQVNLMYIIVDIRYFVKLMDLIATLFSYILNIIVVIHFL